MTRKLPFAALLCGLAAGAAFTGAVFPAAAQPAAPGTLRIGLADDPDALDPTLSRTYVGRIVFAGLCDKLFDIDDKLNIVPQLATGYEYADPTTLVIKLRAGVTFHDGEKFDSDTAPPCTVPPWIFCASAVPMPSWPAGWSLT